MRLIVTQLLQYARPTEYAGYTEALDANQLVDDCLVLVQHLLAKTGIEVQRDLRALHPAGFNRQELQQVVINLLINAIQAMPQGGVLRLSTRDLPDGVALTVEDSGPGLSPAVMERLFRPFFTTKNDGNGLGLWISVGLVERYGGSLVASNRSDGTAGAIFTLNLLSEPQPPAAASTQDGRPGPQPG
jgi:two-component system NtrC family sensor kinase